MLTRSCVLQILDSISIPVDLDDRESLLQASNTCALTLASLLCTPLH